MTLSDIKSRIDALLSMGKTVEKICLSEDLQEQLITDVHEETPGGRLTMLFDYPVITTERGSGLEILYS